MPKGVNERVGNTVEFRLRDLSIHLILTNILNSEDVHDGGGGGVLR